MQSGAILGLDDAITALFRVAGQPAQPIGPAWVQEMGRDVTALGSLVFLGFVVAAALGYLALTGYMSEARELLLSGAVATVAAFGLKLVFERTRPDIVHLARTFTSSFPSGHATLSVAIFSTLALIVSRHQRSGAARGYICAVTTILIAAVGISRVYLGVHYPSDVLAGWALGLLSSIASASIAGARSPIRADA
ncbi:MAG TPA: phosphatase PAP2 family protein [Bosea sp. (in: a-proteobacteria)]|uniref:phosphatase PAP2 family protein n=1 Tax=Bosea sp. (in: a-proteobacteria) TaxID=1871050 RepID=UPI002E1505A5|nr:phosphatase PAP2 family protein [Bosea sp. (in: a-proteobacteria)]